MTTFKRHLFAAAGYCELCMWQDAWDELDHLEPDEKGESEVLRLRLRVYTGTRQWCSAAVLAISMVANEDRDASTFIFGGQALCKCDFAEDAIEFLRQGEEFLSNNALFQYTLAMANCRLGNLQAAKVRLQLAFRINPGLRLEVTGEPDLAPLW